MLIKLIEKAKEEMEIGSPEKAETILNQARNRVSEITVALQRANTALVAADPVEAASILDLLLMNEMEVHRENLE